MFDDDKDDYNKFIERLKKYLNVDSDIFDAEFYIFPGNELGEKFGLNPEDEGFKISYHYEKGMDKPDVRIQGNVDENKVKDYIKKMNHFQNNPRFREYMKKANAQNRKNIPKSQKLIDANELSLRSQEDISHEDDGLKVEEPFTEINDCVDELELILEVPGIKENDIFISLNDDKNILTFSAENEKKRYHKRIQLPCKASILNDTLSISNGILTFKCCKK